MSAEVVPVITTLPAAPSGTEAQRVITYTRYGVPLRVDPLYPAEPIFAALAAETVPLALTSGPSVADQAEGAAE